MSIEATLQSCYDTKPVLAFVPGLALGLQKEVMMSTLGTMAPPAAAAPLLRDEALYEVVNGQKVELPPMSVYANSIAGKLHTRLDVHAGTHGLGRVLQESLFILDPVRDVRRRPDVAFVSAQKWPLDRPLPVVGDWQVVPDLAIEVISPNDLFQDVYAKMQEYFRLGVRQVWLVSPGNQLVHVYDSPTSPRVLTAADELDGGVLLPGLRLPVGSLFQPQSQAASTP
jgi:Uma2 family endonuclease